MLKAGIEKLTKTSNKSYVSLQPNFLIPGSGRAGSTFLYSCLKQHPEIFFSTIKEPSYFSKYYDLGDEWYLKHFKARKNYSRVGEASTQYFYTIKAAKRIFDFNPDFRLIFIIRNPVIRAYSNYTREIQLWGENRPFEEVLTESKRYVWPAMYYTHLSRFLEYFPKEQLYVIIFEKFIKQIDFYLAEICKFLDINPNFRFNQEKFTRNPSKMPINTHLQKLNRNLFQLNRREPYFMQVFRVGGRTVVNSINHLFYKAREFPQMKKSTRNYLMDYFYDEIIKLEELLKEDLSIWKNK